MSTPRFSHITICIEKAETSFEGKNLNHLVITPVCLSCAAAAGLHARQLVGGIEEPREEPQRRDSLNELKTACLHGGRLTHSEEEEKFASKDGDAAERGRELTGSPAV